MDVLVISYDAPLRATIATCYAASGYSVTTGWSAVEALSLIRHKSLDLVVVDLGNSNSMACRQIRSISDVLVIALCEGPQASVVVALDDGADCCLRKPLDLQLLIAHSETLLSRWSARRLSLCT